MLKIAPHKPMLLGEVASNEIGGSKPAWIKNMLREVPRYRKVRGLIWFDVKDRNTHWPLESSARPATPLPRGFSGASTAKRIRRARDRQPDSAAQLALS